MGLSFINNGGDRRVLRTVSSAKRTTAQKLTSENKKFLISQGFKLKNVKQ